MAVLHPERYIYSDRKGFPMSVAPVEIDERPCLHCLLVDLIDQFYAELPSTSGDADSIDSDEVIEAIAKTVAELTSGQDGAGRQKIVEQLMKQIMDYDTEFRQENEAGSASSAARH